MTKAEFLSEASAAWDKLEERKKNSKDFFSYEKAFDELWVEYGRRTLEGSLGSKATNDRRKKKSIKSLRKD